MTWSVEPFSDDWQPYEQLVLDEAAESVYCFAADSVTAYSVAPGQPGNAPTWQVRGQHVPRAPHRDLALASLPLVGAAGAASFEEAEWDEPAAAAPVLATLQGDSVINLIDVSTGNALRQARYLLGHFASTSCVVRYANPAIT